MSKTPIAPKPATLEQQVMAIKVHYADVSLANLALQRQLTQAQQTITALELQIAELSDDKIV